MRNLQALLLLLLVSIVLVGCGDTITELKDAASGINSKANEAATALSMDVHSMRATEIQFDDQTFTINDLYKTILRDVQWYYEKIDGVDTLKVVGTWQDNGLFATANFDESTKKQLLEDGAVTVFLIFPNGQIDEETATISMRLYDEILIEQIGVSSLHELYALFKNIKD